MDKELSLGSIANEPDLPVLWNCLPMLDLGSQYRTERKSGMPAICREGDDASAIEPAVAMQFWRR